MKAEELHPFVDDFFIVFPVSIPLLFPCCCVHASCVVLHPINLHQELLLSAICKPDEHEVHWSTGFGKHTRLRDNVAPFTTFFEHFSCFFLQGRGIAALYGAEVAQMPAGFSQWLVSLLY